MKSSECTCTHAPEQHHNGVGVGCLLHGCACQASRLDISDAVAKARHERIAELEALVEAATRFTFKGPGDYFAAYYDKETDYWLVEDRDGDVCGEHEERDGAVKQARDLAAGTGSIVSPKGK